MKKLFVPVLLITAPAIAGAQTLYDILVAFTNAFGALIVVAVAAALVVFLWGVVTFMMNSDDEQAIIAGKKRMFWGIIALFVIVVIWGIVELLMTVFGVDETPACPPTQIDLNGRVITECDY